jgi:hypothetical protein
LFAGRVGGVLVVDTGRFVAGILIAGGPVHGTSIRVSQTRRCR